MKNPSDAATHRLGVNICSLVGGEKQRETSSIDRSRLRDRRGTVGGSWKDEEQEGRSRQTHGEETLTNVSCDATQVHPFETSKVTEARFSGGKREPRRFC